MAEQFKVGDVVHMKSGGPAMTVQGVYTRTGGVPSPKFPSVSVQEERIVYDCVGFDTLGHRITGEFRAELLENWVVRHV